MEGNIGIFEQEHLELKQVFKLEGISNIYHLEKIKNDNLDLIAVASNLNELIVISVFHNEKEIEDKDNKENKDKKEVNFNYKFVFRKAEHTGKLNRIIQLSNGLVVSSSEDKLVIFWQVIKKEKDEGIILQSITKVEMNRDVHVLIECPFTNELICNDKTIDLKTLLPKRELDFRLEGKHFNCSICLFKDKYLGYVDFCDGISILNIENEKNLESTEKKDEFNITRNNRYNKNYNACLTEGNDDIRKNQFSNSVYNFKKTPKKLKLDIGQSDNFMNSVKKIFLYNNSNNKGKNFYNSIKLDDYKIKRLNKEELA